MRRPSRWPVGEVRCLFKIEWGFLRGGVDAGCIGAGTVREGEGVGAREIGTICPFGVFFFCWNLDPVARDQGS